MKIREVFCKSILSPSKLSCDYAINPYVGCQHGCLWCYARFMKRYTGHNNDQWGSFVDVKINAPEVLIKDIKKLKVHFNNTYRQSFYPSIFFSSVCDPYQPVEAKYRLTRRCLEILSRFPFSVSILTQSKLVVRDIDLFAKFKDFKVGLSLSFHYPSLLPEFKKWRFSDSNYLSQMEDEFEKVARKFKIKSEGVYHHD